MGDVWLNILYCTDVFCDWEQEMTNSKSRWEKGVRQRTISALSELWFADCCCCCSFWSSSGWPPSRHHGRADDCFSRLQLLFVINILQNRVRFDPRSLKKLNCSQFTFMSSFQCKYCILNSSEWHDHSIQGSLIDNKEFLFRLLLAAWGELIISDLNPYRLFLQYWLLIRNDPDALISAFPTITIAKRLGIVVIDHHDNYYSTSGKWLWHSG